MKPAQLLMCIINNFATVLTLTTHETIGISLDLWFHSPWSLLWLVLRPLPWLFGYYRGLQRGL